MPTKYIGKDRNKCKVHGHIDILQMDESKTPHEPVRVCYNCGIELMRPMLMRGRGGYAIIPPRVGFAFDKTKYKLVKEE